MMKRSTFSGRLLRALALGLPGVLALLLALPEIEGVPRLALLANPAIFLLLAAVAGATLAGSVELRSRLVAGDAVTASALAIPAVAGIASGLIMAGLDELLSRAWRDISDAPSLISGWSPAQLIVGLFYGGVTEEIMMRWGLLSALAALLLRLFGRGGRGRVITLVAAVVLSAALFAASHLPMLYLDGVPPGPLVARTLALNSLLGLFFGAVFVRSGLEAAIVAHGGFHLGVMVAALTAWLLPV